MARTRALVALAASVGLHAIPLAQALTRAAAPAAPPPSETSRPEPAAAWAGETFDIDALASGSSTSAPSPSPDPPLPDAAPAGLPSAALAASPKAAPEVASAPESIREPTAPRTEVPPEQTAAPAPRVNAAPDSVAGPPSSTGTSDAPGGSAAGAYGQAGAVTVSAPLGKGLLRALPRVAFVEPTFHELAAGATGRAVFRVTLDAEGHPESPAHFDEDRPRLRWLESIVDRALLLLRGGTFSAPASAAGLPEATFELEFEVTEGPPVSGDWLEPHDLAEIGRMIEPTLDQPGRAHFRYNSGREVRLVLTLIPRRTTPPARE